MYVKLIMKHKSRFICTATFPPCCFFLFFEKGKSLSFFIFHAKQHSKQNVEMNIECEIYYFSLHLFQTIDNVSRRCSLNLERKNFKESLTSQLSSVLKFIPHTCDICVWIYSKFFALSLRMRKTNQILMRLHYIAQFISRLRSLIHTLL